MAYIDAQGYRHLSLDEAKSGYVAKTTADRDATGKVVGNSQGSNYVRSQEKKVQTQDSNYAYALSTQEKQAAQQQIPVYSQAYLQQNARLQEQIKAVEQQRPTKDPIVNQNIKERTLSAFNEGYKAGQGGELSLARLQAPATSAKDMLTYSLAEKANVLSDKINAVQNPALKSLPNGVVKDFVTGVTNIPEMVVSAAGNAPLGVESMVRNPTTISDSIALGLGTMTGAAVKKAQTHPAELVGELVGPKVISKTVPKVTTPVGRIAGESTGLIRTKTFGSPAYPYKSPGLEIESIFEKDFITGSRAATKEPTTIGKAIRTRDPASKGDIGAGTKGTFMTIGSKDLEPYGKVFTNKELRSEVTGTGLKADILKKAESIENSLPGKKRVFLQEVRTVKVPESLKSEIYTSIEKTGNFEKQYPEVVRLANEQSAALHEPIAIPSPKRAVGFPEPENEVFVVMTGEKAATVTGKSFAGFTNEGAIIFKLRYGNQSKPKGVFSNLAENIEYNFDMGLARTGLYKKGHLNAMAEDMNRRQAELHGDAFSYPNAYEFGKHGPTHAKNVENNLLDIGVSKTEAKMLSEYHDIAKIGPRDEGPIPHAEAAEIAIKTGKFTTPELASLSESKRNALAKDIGTHTNINPLNIHHIPSGLRTELIDRPTLQGKALATADRIDLTRFGIEVDQSKLFFKPGETIISTATTGKQSIFSDTTTELFPIKSGETFPETAVPSKGLVTAEEIFSTTNYENQGSKRVMPEINININPSSSVIDPVRTYKDPFISSRSAIDPVEAYRGPLSSSKLSEDSIEAYRNPFKSSNSRRSYEAPFRYSKTVIDPVGEYINPFRSSKTVTFPFKYIPNTDKHILDYKPLPNKPDYTQPLPNKPNYTPPPPNPDDYTPLPPTNPDDYTPPPPSDPDDYTPPPSSDPDDYTPPPPDITDITPPPPNPFSSNFDWDIDPFKDSKKHKKTKKKMLKNPYGDPFSTKLRL